MTQTHPTSPLRWSIKRRLIDYVLALPGGGIDTDGVDWTGNAGDAFVFPPALGAPGRFRGSVRLTGHRGILDVLIADIHLACPATRPGVVSITRRPGDESTRIELAVFDQPGSGGATPSDGKIVVPSITFDGARHFGDYYGVGTPLDPFALPPPAPVSS